MKRFFFWIWVTLGLGVMDFSNAQDFADAQEVNRRLGRGINMGNSFEAPTETAWGNPWKPEYFAVMADIGFSHVRIPVRWTTDGRSENHPPYTIQDSFLERVQQAVDTALAHGLHAIINMHHHEEIFQNPMDEKGRFLSQWEQISSFFKDYPDSLVFEILNEPHDELTPELWNDFLREALTIIRVDNPDRVVMIGTARWGGLSGLPKLDWPHDDPQLILTLHYYEPFQFTHQGAEWTGDFTREWIGTTWEDTPEERQQIMDDFAFTLEFSRKHNIPVHMGEFGAIYHADLPSRVRWTHFLARWFEEQHFSWAYWEFSAEYFGIYRPEEKDFLQPLKEALLQNPMPQPR